MAKNKPNKQEDNKRGRPSKVSTELAAKKPEIKKEEPKVKETIKVDINKDTSEVNNSFVSFGAIKEVKKQEPIEITTLGPASKVEVKPVKLETNAIENVAIFIFSL